MSQQKTKLEVIAPTVEEAIERGLQQLGLPREAVEVEVLDEGSRGFLGLGSRQARVRLALKDLVVQTNTAAAVTPQAQVESSKPSVDAPTQTQQPEQSKAEVEHIAHVAHEVVAELLEKMKVKAEVTTRFVPPVDERDQESVVVEVHGNDLSILIGRRSETLNALQYIASLIVSKEIGRWVPLMIDVQGYRSRRERQLQVLAQRMAEQAVSSGKRQTLEPMSASERRVIHLELRNHPAVETESIGEEPNRKVVIRLKKTER
ncbi:MAG: protein jag [Anaerolinea sp.]|nr:protein jag [Anaerolinea sp.]